MPRDRERRREHTHTEPVDELRIAKEDESLLVRPVSDIDEFKKMMGEEDKVCPNCGSQTNKYYYCNYCGKEFCRSCAENSEKKGMTEYTCPNCSKKNLIQ